MTTVRLTGWQPGIRKISLTKLLQAKANLSLSAAKGMVDRVLEGHTALIELPSHVDVDAFISEIRALGALCEVA